MIKGIEEDNDKNPTIILQARSGSHRLPGKVNMVVNGMTLIERVYKICSEVYPTIVAIPRGDVDLIRILNFCGIPYYEGDQDDVLKRYYDCAKSLKLQHLIRVTGDCPQLSQESLYWVGEHGKLGNYDLYSNVGKGRKAIDGEDVEYMTWNLLEWLYMSVPRAQGENKDSVDYVGQGDTPNYREHVTKYLYDCLHMVPRIFRFKLWRDSGKDMSFVKSSIDNSEDLINLEYDLLQHDVLKRCL